MDWSSEMAERCDRHRRFDEAFWSACPGGGLAYECGMPNAAYADRDGAEGRQAWFASLGTTSDEGLASKRPRTPAAEPRS